jgi:cytosine/adenosine deaminase-related metal-dependent hydrolase
MSALSDGEERTMKDMSRRQFLRATTAGAVATPVSLAALAGHSAAAGPATAKPTAGRPILLKGGCVLSLDRQVGDFEKADVLVEKGKIVAVRPGISAPNAEVIDASRAIVMPGFVDTHRHMWEGILRNILTDGTLIPDYFRDIQGILAPAYTPEDVYAGNLVSMLGAIDAGVTTVLDWSHIQNSPEHTDAAIQALRDSGGRAVFAYGSPQLGPPNKWWEDSRQHKYPEDIRRLRKQYFSSEDQLLTLALAGIAFPTDIALSSWKLAREVGARITVHVGVGRFGKRADVQKLGEAGALKSDTTYIHACTLNNTEWRMIADTGGTISLAGYVEMIMGHGTPPIQKCLDHGIRPSLSIDVETSVPTDMFTQMRTIFSLQRNDVLMRGLADEKPLPPLLKTRDVLEFGTIEGARANGLESKIGTLTPGKQADIIVLRTDRFDVLPMNNATGAVVSSMGTGNVDTVLIAGKVMKRNGRLLGVDVNKVSRLAYQARDRVVARSKFQRVPL